MNQDFVDLLRALCVHDVRFLIVGAYALAVHGRPRATGDLDVLTTLSGLTFDEAWPDRVSATFGDAAVSVIGRDAFIRNKRATGRAKDLGDIEALDGGA